MANVKVFCTQRIQYTNKYTYSPGKNPMFSDLSITGHKEIEMMYKVLTHIKNI